MYRSALYNQNVRNFLGFSRTTGQINKKLRETIEKESEATNFLAYHNGMTILCHGIEFKEIPKRVTIKGFSIINGAQTATTISKSSIEPGTAANIVIRFITQANPQTQDNIKRYNNTQNPVLPSDFRNDDDVQNRLLSLFNSSYPLIHYNAIKRSASNRPPVVEYKGQPQQSKILHLSTLARILYAFHHAPFVAHRNGSDILTDTGLYSSIFSSSLTADHAVFVASCDQAIDNMRKRLKRDIEDESEADSASRIDPTLLRAHEVLYGSGGPFLGLYFFRIILEKLHGKRIAKPFSVIFTNRVSTIEQGATLLAPVLFRYRHLFADLRGYKGGKMKDQTALHEFLSKKANHLLGHSRDSQIKEDLQGILLCDNVELLYD